MFCTVSIQIFAFWAYMNDSGAASAHILKDLLWNRHSGRFTLN
jgi:hypothetical protein